MTTSPGDGDPVPSEQQPQQDLVEFLQSQMGNPQGFDLLVRAFYSGPVPLPKMIEEWERVVPGAGTRMFDWAEAEGKQRRWLERTYVYYRFAGLVIGALVTLFTIGVGAYLANHDKSLAGVGLVVAELVALVGVFVLGRHLQNGDSAEGENSSQ